MLGFRSDPKARGKNLELSWLKKADEKKIEQLFDSILTRMLVFFSKSHRKGLGKHGKNFKTKFR
ncbi:hypothetical protein BTM502_11260 [Helicobacter pylori]